METLRTNKKKVGLNKLSLAKRTPMVVVNEFFLVKNKRERKRETTQLDLFIFHVYPLHELIYGLKFILE